jgi:hypothetical protein
LYPGFITSIVRCAVLGLESCSCHGQASGFDVFIQ